MVAPARALLRQDALGDAPGPIVVDELGEERRLDRVAPVVGELLERPSQGAPEGAVDPARDRSLEDLADDLVAPALADVGEQGVAEVVGEDARVEGQLLDRGQGPLERRVAQPHRGQGIDRAEGQVLRHPLHKPQRRVHVAERLEAPADPAAAEHVELELVHHLVLEHVLELGIGAGERQHHAVLERLGDAPHALAAHIGHVRLLEVRRGGIQDDRLARLELVMEDPRQPRIAALGHAGGVECRGTLPLVEVDLEVLRPDDLEVELPVLDLVLAEVLPRQRPCTAHEERRRQSAEPSHKAHPFDPPSGAVRTSGASPHRRSS